MGLADGKERQKGTKKVNLPTIREKLREDKRENEGEKKKPQTTENANSAHPIQTVEK